VESVKAQLEERNNQYMRIAADFENFRKRTQKERLRAASKAQHDYCRWLITSSGRDRTKPQTDAELSIHKSYQSVYKQLVDCLKRLGVSAMRPEGNEFSVTRSRNAATYK